MTHFFYCVHYSIFFLCKTNVSGIGRCCVHMNKIHQSCWKWRITNHNNVATVLCCFSFLLCVMFFFFKYLDFIKHIHPVDSVVNLVPYHFQFIHHMVTLIYEYSVKIQFSWAAIARDGLHTPAIAPDLLYLPLLKQ